MKNFSVFSVSGPQSTITALRDQEANVLRTGKVGSFPSSSHSAG